METQQVNKNATWRKLLDLVDFSEIFFHGYKALFSQEMIKEKMFHCLFKQNELLILKQKTEQNS